MIRENIIYRINYSKTLFLSPFFNHVFEIEFFTIDVYLQKRKMQKFWKKKDLILFILLCNGLQDVNIYFLSHSKCLQFFFCSRMNVLTIFGNRTAIKSIELVNCLYAFNPRSWLHLNVSKENYEKKFDYSNVYTLYNFTLLLLQRSGGHRNIFPRF